MTVSYSINYRPNRLSCFTLVKLFSLQNLIKQLTTFHQLHYQAVMRFILEEIYESDNVGVVYSFHYLNLIFEWLDVFLRHFSFGENFDGHILICLSVLGLSNSGKRPLANCSLNFVQFFDISEVAAYRWLHDWWLLWLFIIEYKDYKNLDQ